MAADEPQDDRTQSFVALTKDTMVSHYRIIEKIGAGGMGEVYLAEDIDLDRRVALKFLPSYLYQDEECRRRFKREAKATARLSHPNIIHVYEVSEYRGRLFYAMEYVKGKSLREHIKEQTLTVKRVIDLATQICEGMGEAHEAGIVHRDIKPSNILVEESGRPKIADFGLATVMGRESLTDSSTTMGTLAYMSPEQIEGQQIDSSSDLFSFGIVLYEMIAGRRPFNGDSKQALLYSILNSTPKRLSDFLPELPDELEQTIVKLLRKNRTSRHQNAGEVLRELKAINKAASNLSTIAAKKSPGRKTLAVLPFESLDNSDDEYFADGVTEEIIAKLATIPDIGVISRTSVIRYRNTRKSMREIVSDLGVDYVLEGTIRWDRSAKPARVRVNSQLIQASDDTHLWADRYDAELESIFGVQARIADRVANALGVTLLATDRVAGRDVPLVDPDAYEFYLRGNQFYRGDSEHALENATKMYVKAIEIDSDFVPALSKLARVHIVAFHNHFDHSKDRLIKAKDLINRAIDLEPENVEALKALGVYEFIGHSNCRQALKQYAVARRKQPNDTELLGLMANAHMSAGDWDVAIGTFREAVELNPLDETLLSKFGTCLLFVRRYTEARELLARAISVAPDRPWVYTNLAWGTVLQRGETGEARGLIRDALQSNERWPHLTYVEFSLELVDRNFASALDHLDRHVDLFGLKPSQEAYHYCLKGDVNRLLGRKRPMIEAYGQALAAAENDLDTWSDEPSPHAMLAKASAGMGDVDVAKREIQAAVKLRPLTVDAVYGSHLLRFLADAWAIIGQSDRALDYLEQLSEIPSLVSTEYLRMWPDCLPLHDHPRFQALLKKYGDNQPGT